MTDDIVRDARGRIVKGSPGLRRKPEQSDQPAEPDTSPSLDSSFDDDLIAAAESFGKPRAKTGRRAWCEALRDQKPTEFAALLKSSLARKAAASSITGSGVPSVTVFVDSIPSGQYVDANLQPISEAQAKSDYTAKTGVIFGGEPLQPLSKPVLVSPDDDADDQSDDDDDPPPHDRGGISMNELWRRNTVQPKWKRKRDDEW